MEKADETKHIQHLLLVTVVIILPALQGTIFGWVHGLLPLLVFYYLRRYGANRGRKYIVSGGVLACIVGLMFQVFEQLLFALTLIPLGFILSNSVETQDSIPLAGIKGTLALAGSWALVTSLLTLGLEQHPYILLLNSLDFAMNEAIILYKQDMSISAETLFVLDQTFSQMRIWIPKLMPGFLFCLAMLLTCSTMAIGNRMLFKNTGSSPWPAYKHWSLPDKLVWGLIASTIMVVLPMASGRTIGANVLMVCGVLYCFQGIAIMLFFFSKWRVPLFVRTLVYVLLFFQTFGVIVLGLIGIFDVWADLRRLNKSEQNSD